MGLFLIAPDEICAAVQPKIRYLVYRACEPPTAVFPGTENPHKDEARLQGAISTTRVFLQVSSDTKQYPYIIYNLQLQLLILYFLLRHKCRVIDVSDQKVVTNVCPHVIYMLCTTGWFQSSRAQFRDALHRLS